MDWFIVLEWRFLDYIYFSPILSTSKIQINVKPISGHSGWSQKTPYRLYHYFFVSLTFSRVVSNIYSLRRSISLRKFFELNCFVCNIKLVRFNILDYSVVKTLWQK